MKIWVILTFLITLRGEVSYSHFKSKIGSQFRNSGFPVQCISPHILLHLSQGMSTWLQVDGWLQGRRAGQRPLPLWPPFPSAAAGQGPGWSCESAGVGVGQDGGGGAGKAGPKIALQSGVCEIEHRHCLSWGLTGAMWRHSRAGVPHRQPLCSWRNSFIPVLTDSLLRPRELSSPPP